MQKYVAYYRVSTQKQGASGLGLEWQRQLVQKFVNCNECVISEFTEIESGGKNSRVELLKAIDFAKANDAKLVIAKLDRLSRNAAFVLMLKETKVDFVCADMPDANTLTIGILAVMAQHELEIIRQRTKAGLDVKRQQLAAIGKKLGTPANLTAEARAKGLAVRQLNAKCKKENVQATELALLYRGNGLTLKAISEKLNTQGYKTSWNKCFKPTTIKMLLDRATKTAQHSIKKPAY